MPSQRLTFKPWAITLLVGKKRWSFVLYCVILCEPHGYLFYISQVGFNVSDCFLLSWRFEKLQKILEFSIARKKRRNKLFQIRFDFAWYFRLEKGWGCFFELLCCFFLFVFVLLECSFCYFGKTYWLYLLFLDFWYAF